MGEDITHDNTQTNTERHVPSYRTLIHIGHSRAITLPPKFANDVAQRSRGIVQCWPLDDGTLLIIPFADTAGPPTVSARPTRPDHDSRPTERPTEP